MNVEESRLRSQKLLKRKRGNFSLETLILTCSSVGQSLQSLIKSSKISSNKDYHFGLSIAETLGKITDQTKKTIIM